MGGEVDGAGIDELEARIEAHAPSTRAFKQPIELPIRCATSLSLSLSSLLT